MLHYIRFGGEPEYVASLTAAKIAASRHRASFVHSIVEMATMLKEEIRKGGGNVGSFEACLTAVKSLKIHAEYVKADIEAKRKRGTLIERAAVERTVFPYIDLTQRRVLQEVPRPCLSRSSPVCSRVGTTLRST